MEFAEVENLQDFYSAEERFVHTQDQRGFYIVYDAALRDLDELENELLLIGSHFIWTNGTEKMGQAEASASTADLRSWAQTDVDRVAVLLDLWTCETEFLESKVQLLNCYCEAYQHTAGTEERSALARVITDIMHHRPQLDLNQDYFAQAYRAEIDCLRSHQQLIKDILDNQIEKQRQYLRRIWRIDRKASSHDFGLPLNYIPKHLVSLGGSSPAQMNVFLLEVHPSLCLASAVYQGLVQAHSELCQLHRATSASDKLALQRQLLRRALHGWNHLTSPGASYSPQIQKDVGVFFEDPLLVQKVGRASVKSAEEKDMQQGTETQSHAVATSSRLLELVTVRHRLLESASETAHLAQLYRSVASELGFSEAHLYLRPVQFEAAEQGEQTERRPILITAVLEDDTSVDRFIPSHLPLGIQELDEDQIGRFSFSSEEEVTRLMTKQSIENLQVTLACQVAQKNALISAVQVASLCHWAGSVTSSAESEEALHHHDEDLISSTCFDSRLGRSTDNPQEKSNSSPPSGVTRTPNAKQRLTEAFVSVQREKVGLRDEMLHSFTKKRQAAGGLAQAPGEAAKIKRSLIIEFLQKFSTRISQYCVRAQIVAYYSSLSSLLDDTPSIRQSHFMTERAGEPRVVPDSGADLCPDPSRPQRLLSADGQTLLDLWVVPPVCGVLHMFETLETSACAAALHHTLHIVSALHDVTCYLVSFSRLGNTEISRSGRRVQQQQQQQQQAPGSGLVADWGGTEGIGAELLEIQRQVDRLPDPSSPESVGRLLQLRRQVLLLRFDAAVRHLIREAFLSAGDVASYQSVSDNMAAALPLLSDSVQSDVFSLTLPVPPPLETRGRQDPLRVQSVLKGFLLLTKQLQVFKESWARRRLGVDVFSTPGSYRQFVNLYRAEIFYPSMKALAQQMELWKKSPLRCSLSPERPQIVETFAAQLMDGAEQVEGQDLKNLSESQTNNPHKEVSGLCRGMALEISALQARVAHLEEERRSSEEQLGLRFKERYDPLVRHLFSTCIQLKARLDEHRRQTQQDVSEMVNRTRREGVDRIMKLKEKYGCTTDDDGLALTQSKKEEVHELSLENSRLTALLGKLKALRRWRQVVDEETLHRRLLQTQQREITSRTEALRVKMAAEEEAVSLQEELDVARQMLSRCQAECSRTKKLLSTRTEELQVARHRSAQEARTRQELEIDRAQSLEKMRADVDDRDRQLRALSEQLDRGGRMSQLQRQRSAKEIRQVKGQLHQERCLKQEAFQQVETLKNQVCTGSVGSSAASQTPPHFRTSPQSEDTGEQKRPSGVDRTQERAERILLACVS
ncbi:hypothetical protein F2P81_003179 [Scophthalmus maximus]|uniref:Coiled-coil domain-containing protein 162-like n=1 Tax=Scophthalmus maximus TaxID=52904 RepID=A0A6A4TMG6_SCOMX|nr:hypothetical protein F2P81_003179 [Scophthalmus maximus]